jgi:dienelactone hydrolase
MRFAWALVLAFVFAPMAHAQVRTELVDYRHGDALLEGYLTYDDSIAGQRPGVLVVHEWKGLNDYAKRRAEQLAELGYVAFAVDMYGKGVRAKDHEEAAKLSGIYRNDRQLMRGRIQAALDLLRQHERVDPAKITAVGYCFGGTTVLELARSGADVLGVVSFHGGLDTPTPAQPGQVHARILVLHGASDPWITQQHVAGFEQEMQAAGVRYQVIQYEGAVHSFTVPEAGDDPSKGMAYNAAADAQSWAAMQAFLEEVFAASEVTNVG